MLSSVAVNTDVSMGDSSELTIVNWTGPQSKEGTGVTTKASVQVRDFEGSQTSCVRAGEPNTVFPESIVIGMHGSWKSTLNVKLVPVATPEGVMQVVVMVYSAPRAGLLDSKV